jgi:hypothetical protein
VPNYEPLGSFLIHIRETETCSFGSFRLLPLGLGFWRSSFQVGVFTDSNRQHLSARGLLGEEVRGTVAEADSVVGRYLVLIRYLT